MSNEDTYQRPHDGGRGVTHKLAAEILSPYFLGVKSCTKLLISEREAPALLHTSRLGVGVKKRGIAKLRRGGCSQ